MTVNHSSIIISDERLPRKRQLTEGDISINDGSQIDFVTNQSCSTSLVPIPVNVPTLNSNVGICEKNNSNNEDENAIDVNNNNYEVARV